ncbi:hypothetical protein NM688_g3749 [Phlebia brevispora]|uniref:Uncharacterized protein n=1 Tax=Phlebia brevispora TaxID=194682 RepID=A0ACC1T4V9_9APHY|nr:hypothetical protein NM688_g3749 [Phlebia brevispora]
MIPAKQEYLQNFDDFILPQFELNIPPVLPNSLRSGNLPKEGTEALIQGCATQDSLQVPDNEDEELIRVFSTFTQESEDKKEILDYLRTMNTQEDYMSDTEDSEDSIRQQIASKPSTSYSKSSPDTQKSIQKGKEHELEDLQDITDKTVAMEIDDPEELPEEMSTSTLFDRPPMPISRIRHVPTIQDGLDRLNRHPLSYARIQQYQADLLAASKEQESKDLLEEGEIQKPISMQQLPLSSESESDDINVPIIEDKDCDEQVLNPQLEESAVRAATAEALIRYQQMTGPEARAHQDACIRAVREAQESKEREIVHQYESEEAEMAKIWTHLATHEPRDLTERLLRSTIEGLIEIGEHIVRITAELRVNQDLQTSYLTPPYSPDFLETNIWSLFERDSPNLDEDSANLMDLKTSRMTSQARNQQSDRNIDEEIRTLIREPSRKQTSDNDDPEEYDIPQTSAGTLRMKRKSADHTLQTESHKKHTNSKVQKSLRHLDKQITAMDSQDELDKPAENQEEAIAVTRPLEFQSTFGPSEPPAPMTNRRSKSKERKPEMETISNKFRNLKLNIEGLTERMDKIDILQVPSLTDTTPGKNTHQEESGSQKERPKEGHQTESYKSKKISQQTDKT